MDNLNNFNSGLTIEDRFKKWLEEGTAPVQNRGWVVVDRGTDDGYGRQVEFVGEAQLQEHTAPVQNRGWVVVDRGTDDGYGRQVELVGEEPLEEHTAPVQNRGWVVVDRGTDDGYGRQVELVGEEPLEEHTAPVQNRGWVVVDRGTDDGYGRQVEFVGEEPLEEHTADAENIDQVTICNRGYGSINRIEYIVENELEKQFMGNTAPVGNKNQDCTIEEDDHGYGRTIEFVIEEEFKKQLIKNTAPVENRNQGFVDKEGLSGLFQRHLFCSEESAALFASKVSELDPSSSIKMTKKEGKTGRGFAAKNGSIYIHDKVLLAEGNFKKTYEAHRVDANSGQLEEIVHQKGKDGFDVRAIEDEVLVQQRFDHPNIVKIYDYNIYKSDQKIAIYAEKCGLTLNDAFKHLKNGNAFNRQVQIGIFKDTALALEYLHTQGYSHNDIKPDNILIKNQRGKLADFGLCKPAGSRLGFWCNQTYAPEWPGMGELGDRTGTEKTDIYQFGVTMELLIMDGSLDNWRCKSEEDRVLRQLVVSCKDKDPAKRPSMQDVVKTLSGLLPESAIPDSDVK